MKYTHCRGCGRVLNEDSPDADFIDGLCSYVVMRKGRTCFVRFMQHLGVVMARPAYKCSDPEWSALIDLWLEKGMP